MLTNASDADKALVLEAMDGIMPKAETVDEAAMEKKFEDAKNTAISKFMDSKAFKDAMLNYGNERTAIVSKAKNFLDSKFDFKDKTNEAIMAAVVSAEYPNETFKDAEIGVAFKLLKEREQTSQSQVVDFKDAKENIKKVFDEEMK
jgi:hypothetical protein